jgi:hypothetical protein
MENTLESQPVVDTRGAATAPAPGDATVKQKKVRTPYPLHFSRWVLRAVTFLTEFIAFFLIVGLASSCRTTNSDDCYVLFELVFVRFFDKPPTPTFSCISRRQNHATKLTFEQRWASL